MRNGDDTWLFKYITVAVLIFFVVYGLMLLGTVEQ
tara:strand:+ start:416 stop:520 length:105 start_codon:yes stop_codon:yes gene_type:complete